MRKSRPLNRMVIGLILAVAGVVWTLQGAGLFPGEGGMNDEGFWVVAGAVTAVVGAALAYLGYQDRSRS